MSPLADHIRAEFKRNDDIRDAGLATPADIVRCDDICYGADPRTQSLDVYRPRAAEGQALPVIVSVHGGGWVYGDKERYQYYCMSLAQRGFAVVNFTYRLAPEAKYPAQLEDVNAVFAWVLDNAARYGFDAAHVFAVGDSAGAHLLSLYGCLCTNPDTAARYAFRPPEGFAPTAVALNCGAYIVDVDGLIQELLPNRGTPEEQALISPLEQLTGAFPPAFVMTSDGDFLKPQAPVMAAKLQALNVPYALRFYVGRDAPLPHVFHCDMRSADGRLCNDEECDFFRRFL